MTVTPAPSPASVAASATAIPAARFAREVRLGPAGGAARALGDGSARALLAGALAAAAASWARALRAARFAREVRLGPAGGAARAVGDGSARALLAGVLAVAVCGGCARDARLDARVDEVARGLAEAEALGALRCAPRELAIARSQLGFARLERDQGDTAAAREHLGRADENVRAARLLARPGRCPPPAESSGVSPGGPPAATD